MKHLVALALLSPVAALAQPIFTGPIVQEDASCHPQKITIVPGTFIHWPWQVGKDGALTFDASSRVVGPTDIDVCRDGRVFVNKLTMLAD